MDCLMSGQGSQRQQINRETVLSWWWAVWHSELECPGDMCENSSGAAQKRGFTRCGRDWRCGRTSRWTGSSLLARPRH